MHRITPTFGGTSKNASPVRGRRYGGKFYNPKKLPRLKKTMNRGKFGFAKPHGQEA